MTRTRRSAAFIGPEGGRLFSIFHCPVGGRRDCVLLVPPFAEEMNKTRRMLTLVAQALAARGFLCVLPDLYGTGDSDGDFEDASWDGWRQDLGRVRSHLLKEGVRVSHAVAVRTGCALLAEAAKQEAWALSSTVFWQPVSDGSRYLRQFLRLRVAASLMEDDRRETVGELRSRLRDGQSLEVAGYQVSSRLADELDKVSLAPDLSHDIGDLHWIEIVRGGGHELSQTSSSIIDAAREKGIRVESATIRGEPFWSSTEIVRISPLIERTVDTLVAA